MIDAVIVNVISSGCYDLIKKTLPKANSIDREFSDVFYKTIKEVSQKFPTMSEVHFDDFFELEKVTQAINNFKNGEGNIDFKLLQEEFTGHFDEKELDVNLKEVLEDFFERLEINMNEKPNLRKNLEMVYFKDLRKTTINIEQKIEQVSSKLNDIEDFFEKKGKGELVEELIIMGKTLCENKDFDGCIEYYEKARNKLEEGDNKKLILKIKVGEAVCYINKGNKNKALKLLYEAEEIESENPVILANLASIHRVMKDVRISEDYAKKALELDENNVLALTVLALIEHDNLNVESALGLLKKASNLDNKDSYSRYALSFVYAMEEKYEKAKTNCIKAIELEPLNAQYHSHLGLIFLKASNPIKNIHYEDDIKKLTNFDYVEKAIKCLDKAIELNNQQGNSNFNSEIYINLGSAFLLKGDTDKSIFYSNKAIESGETCDEVCINLGHAYLNGKNYEKAIRVFEHLIKKGVNNLDIRGNLGLAYIFENKLDKAEFLFNDLILEYPKDKNLYTSLAKVCELKGDFEKGIELLNEGIKNVGSDWIFHYILGRFYYRVEIFEKAAEEFKKAIKKQEMAIEPRQDLIDMYIKLKIPKPAEKYAKELIKIDSKNKVFNFYRSAYIYYQLKNYDESIRYLDLALSEENNVIGVHRLLCAVLIESKQISKAKSALEKALKVFPNDIELNTSFSAFLFESGELDRAIDALNSIIQSNPKYIPSYLSISNLYILKGDFEKSIDISKTAISIDPNNEDAHYRLAISLLHSGRTDDSVKELNLIREINPNSHYVRVLDFEEIKSFLEDRFETWKTVIDFYQKGNITVGKAAEILKSDVVSLLYSFDNKKVSEELKIPKDELIELENECKGEENVVVDITTLGILVQIGKIELIKKIFKEICISKEVEEEVLVGLSGGNLTYRAIGDNLERLKKGWIKVLTPSKKTIEVLSKLVPEASGKELSQIALALDNKFLYLTDDLLLRRRLRKIEITSCGIIGIIKYAINQKTISKLEGEAIFKKAIDNGYSPTVDKNKVLTESFEIL